MHFPFRPTSGLGSLSLWFRFPWACIIARCRISHFTTASLPDGTFLRFSLALRRSPWRLSWGQSWRSKSRWVSPYLVLSIFDHFCLHLWVTSIRSGFRLRSVQSWKRSTSSLSVAVALCNRLLRKCEGITFRFPVFRMLGFRPAKYETSV
jgi:hypothetical protein